MRTEPIAVAALLAILTAGVDLAQNGARSEPSVRITGRVVDTAGRPVPGADVKVRLPSNFPRDSQWSYPFPSTDELGQFEILAPRDSAFDLAARADMYGTAYAVELRFEQDARVDDLVLRGEGRLTGSVRFPSGAPVRGLPIAALSRRICAGTDGRMPVELDDNGRPRAGVPVWYPSSNAWRAERDDGLLQTHAETDDEGRFEFSGLAPGEFFLEADCFGGERLQVADQGWWKPGSEPIALVADLHRGRFRLRERDGSSFEPAAVYTWVYVGPPVVHRYATLPSGRRLIDQSISMVDLFLHDSSADVWLEPGSYYAWTHFDQGKGLFGEFTFSDSFFEVRSDHDEFVVEVKRVDDSPTNSGRIDVVVRGEWSELDPYERGMFVGVMDESGLRFLLGAEPGIIALPPGRYLVGGSYRAFDLKAGPVLGAGALWECVDVRAGETVPVAIEWTAPGSLRLALATSGTGDLRGSEWPETELDWRRSVTSWLVPRDIGPAEPVGWVVAGHGDGDETMRPVPPITLESRDAHAPGSYDLVVWREGLDPIVTPLEIKTGELTEVRVVVPEPAD